MNVGIAKLKDTYFPVGEGVKKMANLFFWVHQNPRFYLGIPSPPPKKRIPKSPKTDPENLFGTIASRNGQM